MLPWLRQDIHMARSERFRNFEAFGCFPFFPLGTKRCRSQGTNTALAVPVKGLKAFGPCLG
jgi:hypothetical protein